MTASPFEVPDAKKLEMPERYKHLEVFPVDQATLVAEQHGEDIGSFRVPGSERKLRHVGHDPVWEGGNYDTGIWWLTRLYTEGPHHDLDIASMLQKSPAVVSHKLGELKKHLEDPYTGAYFVVVDSLTHPTRHDDSQLHRLARLREVGMTDHHELFSVLEQEDGGLGYRALTPVKGTVQSALYR